MPPLTNHHRAGLGLKAAWFGAEVLGDLMGGKGKQEQQTADSISQLPASGAVATQEQQQQASISAGVRSVPQILDSIRADYADDYFISGKGAMVSE